MPTDGRRRILDVPMDEQGPDATGIDPWYVENLACPRDHGPLAFDGAALQCTAGHRYPVIDGLPVMLLDDVSQTMPLALASMSRARGEAGDGRVPGMYLESLGISDEEKAGIVDRVRAGTAAVDPVVSFLVGATSGYMYAHQIGKLTVYPIPSLRLPPGGGRSLLDIGCNWGRWSIAAARAGYAVVGIDPSLGAVMAARRVARSMGLPIRHVVGDARFLPFRPGGFDQAFSYSVVQHLSRADAGTVVAEIARVLRPGGESLIQMPAIFGIRCLYHLARRGFRDGAGFEVRYWTIPALRRLFAAVGPSTIEVDCYFGIGLQAADAHLMPPGLRLILGASEALRLVSGWFAPLTYVADSVYVRTVKA